MISRRYWLPLVLSAGTIGLIGRVPAVQDTATGLAPTGARLEFPDSYVVTSPFSRTLDALTLLSNPQTAAALLTIAAVVFLLMWKRGRSWRWWTIRVGALIVGVALLEAAVALLPRPMAKLRVDNPNVVVVDFHSHTGTSHDVRKSFGPEDNREWHSSSGFHAAWITDHVKFAGAVQARTANPERAGDGTSLLTGVEGRYHRIMSTIMLGLDERDSTLLNRRGNLLEGIPARGRPPYTIVALPNRNLDSVTVQSLDSFPRFAAIELIDAAPRGLAQFDREEQRIRGLASRLGLELVAASNNHGYGRAAAAWNLVSVPGWQDLNSLQLGEAIEASLGKEAPTIVMRARPRTHGASLPFTLPVIAYQTLGSLTPGERLSWLLWVWAVPLILRFRRKKISP